MRTIVSILLLLVLFEGLLLLRSRRENKALSGAASQVEPLRSELARAAEAAAQREADLQRSQEELARIQGDLDHSKAALIAVASSEPKQTAASTTEKEVLPLGLSTNDVNLAGMIVRGTNTVGILFIPLVGKCLERIREIRRQPLVFGWPISAGDQGVWGSRDGTNVGFGLRFNSVAEAEATAAKMRQLGGVIDATN